MSAKVKSVGRGLHAVALLGLLVAGACTEESISFRGREVFNPPLDSVNGFLGYFTVADKQTTCGNCHADEQAGWIQTAHANAWADLQGSGHAADYCEGCHTVSERGNFTVAPAGHTAVRDSLLTDSLYFDVQCESCHGPGVVHVGNPAASQPLASFLADTGATNGCGECHSGTHNPFVQQWVESAHGSPSAYAAGREGCNACHEGKKALETKFLETSEYLEKGSEDLMPLACVVCHDPHGGPFEHQLRASISRDDADNLCIKCHNRRTIPPSSHGPHAAQGPLVLGQNVGWFPPGLAWLDGLNGSHGDPDVNAKLCATCHVSSFEVTDPSTGDFLFRSVGHSFEAIPCVDAQGIPEPGPCANSERTFEACAACHGSASNARTQYESFWATLDSLLAIIWVDTDDNHIIDAAPTDAGILPQILQVTGDDKQIDVSDTLFTVAEGVLWNALLASTDSTPRFRSGNTVVIDQGTGLPDTVHFSAHPASANGVHNPPFLDALLKASIQHAISHYSLPAPPAYVDLTFRWARPPGGQ
ncbi:MAG: hypothetical protein GTN62_01020 [Gemmatimonadales bacterium]|nr:hypothetical protein [Gemmatimonadales bacterium]NIN48685.1 hypothetical protein [Gemmatimonadales bacterium]NIP06149.1 hypothetical protein [Gemmatimonadales bacterium]NIR01323.1 hypothetical protein [Gemmatimonadales bacterium]